ncbi:MAG TPA: GNAT family N-acetyltransferase [Blastocatellia bacterium]|jgi:ribosomal protein S18 acetylase RimI-like enzyme
MSEQTTPLIRRAMSTDAALLAELGARTFSDAFAADNAAEDMASYLAASFSPDRQAEELADPRATFLIAEIETTAVGYAQLKSGESPACVKGANPIELVRLYAAKEWIGRRVGEALMRACIAEAEQRGHQTMWLGVWERNERAQRFYRKWGFEVVGEHIFQLGSDSQTDWIMERALAQLDYKK